MKGNMIGLASEASDRSGHVMELLRICDPDEIWISSGRMTTSLSSANVGRGNTVKDLLRNKDVVLISNPDGAGLNYFQNLQNELSTVAHVTVHEWTTPNWEENEIYLRKDDHTVAAITGSSQCIKRDLDSKRRNEDNTEFDYKTDFIFYDSMYSEQIRDLINGLVTDADITIFTAILESGDLRVLETDCNNTIDQMFNDFRGLVNHPR